MVVQNISGEPLAIEELRRIIPSDGKNYIVPYEIASLKKYRQWLKPIQMSDTPAPVQRVIENKYRANVIEIDLDSLDIQTKIFDDDFLNDIKIETESLNEEKSITQIEKPLEIKKAKRGRPGRKPKNG